MRANGNGAEEEPVHDVSDSPPPYNPEYDQYQPPPGNYGPPEHTNWYGLGGPAGQLEDFLLQRVGIIVLLAAILGYQVISAGHMSARIFNGKAPKYEIGEIPGIVWRFGSDPFNPAAAWEPVNTGGEVPGPGAFWLTFVALVAVYFIIWAAVRVWMKRGRGADGVAASEWADDNEIKDLLVDPKEDKGNAWGLEERLVVGTRGRKLLSIDELDSLMVVGPARSGKTGTIAVPTLLEWDGPALIATTKGLTLDETIGWRRTQGRVRIFDPGANTRHRRSGWALLSSCGHWEGSIYMAQHLTAAAYGSHAGWISTDPSSTETGALWGGAMAIALAPYLYAASVTGRAVLDVADWIEREEFDEVYSILAPIDPVAANSLQTSLHRDNPDRSAFFHHIYQLLSVYADPTVAASATKNDIQPEELLDGKKNTVYLTAPEHDRSRFQPLFSAIVRQTLAAANDAYLASGKPFDPPLLVVVDGAVGVASIQLLAQMSTAGGTKGVEIITIFNNSEWNEAVNAGAADTLVGNHRALMLRERAAFGEGASAASEAWARLGHQLDPDEAALFYEDRRPIRLHPRHWTEQDELRQRVEAPLTTIPAEQRPQIANLSPIEGMPDYSLIEQTSAWKRRRSRSADDQAEPVISGPRLRRRQQAHRLNLFAGDVTREDLLRQPRARRRGYRPDS